VTSILNRTVAKTILETYCILSIHKMLLTCPKLMYSILNKLACV